MNCETFISRIAAAASRGALVLRERRSLPVVSRMEVGVIRTAATAGADLARRAAPAGADPALDAAMETGALVAACGTTGAARGAAGDSVGGFDAGCGAVCVDTAVGWGAGAGALTVGWDDAAPEGNRSR
jgi:hypothetical protein